MLAPIDKLQYFLHQLEDLKDIDKQKLLEENSDLTEEELEEKIDKLEKRLKEEKDNFIKNCLIH